MSSSSPPAPESWAQRARVRLACRRLDREIAAGEPLAPGSDRALRARQLVREPQRRATAATLSNILAAAEERAAEPGSSVVVDHAAVLDARAQLLELIDHLRHGWPFSPKAAAVAACLAFDRRSPLLAPRAGVTVRQVLGDIDDA